MLLKTTGWNMPASWKNHPIPTRRLHRPHPGRRGRSHLQPWQQPPGRRRLIEAIRDARKAGDSARLTLSCEQLNDLIFYLET
jgi:hypothetical protein